MLLAAYDSPNILGAKRGIETAYISPMNAAHAPILSIECNSLTESARLHADAALGQNEVVNDDCRIASGNAIRKPTL